MAIEAAPDNPCRECIKWWRRRDSESISFDMAWTMPSPTVFAVGAERII